MTIKEFRVGLILDTQIISYAAKGKLGEPLPSRFSITSTVAQEFLRVRNLLTGDARYFTPPPQGMSPVAQVSYRAGRSIHRGGRPGDRPLFKRATDKVVMDFNNEYPSVVEYGHAGISHLINTANRGIYAESVAHLGKRERKKLVEGFDFLVGHGVECVPVDSNSVHIAFGLLKEAERKGVNIKSDFRNSLNDMLILATARASGGHLWTMDGLLARLAKECGVGEMASRGDYHELSFPQGHEREWCGSRESKGYRNTGWRFVIQQAS
ncbi:hypothetical protein [Streptomyces sp. NPDC019793]|uniref:type II toxin-antitoxin system VapC family toxin n=1 Tax=unclassified Streptomyces TaxID=2593676 RepID=UPI0033D530B9